MNKIIILAIFLIVSGCKSFPDLQRHVAKKINCPNDKTKVSERVMRNPYNYEFKAECVESNKNYDCYVIRDYKNIHCKEIEK